MSTTAPTVADELADAQPFLCDARLLVRDARAWLERRNPREVRRLLDKIDGSLVEVERHTRAAARAARD